MGVGTTGVQKCLREGMSCKQCDPAAERVATCLLFPELQFDVRCGLVTTMVCVVFGS